MDKKNILLILKNYKNQYADKYRVKSLGLFGSVAKEDTNENSDVDVCIILNNPNLLALSRIIQELEEMIKYHVNLIQYIGKKNNYLKDRITKEAIYV